MNMSKELGYKSVGDRVKVKANPDSEDLKLYKNKLGTVIDEDGFGMIEVRLDRIGTVIGWEAAYFDYASKSKRK
jgi:hypothetical protein